MSLRELTLAALFVLAASSVTYGVWLMSTGAAFIVGGVLIAVLSWAALGEVGQ